MKKLGLGLIAIVSLTHAAAAADLGVKGPPVKAPAPLILPSTWTGFYIGAHGGYGWSTSQDIDARGGFGGGQIGYNFQTGNFVFGIEGDFAGADISQTINGDLGIPFTVSLKNDALASLRGRVGIAYNTLLFYGTAGGGWGHNKISVDLAGVTASSDSWQSGWSAGGGVELAFTPSWSAKIEYLHYGLGSANFFGALPSGNIDIDTVKAGINYHFR
jgi:outer membrane immunogenic protein